MQLRHLMQLHHRLLLIFTLMLVVVLWEASESQAQYFHIETMEESDGLPSPDIASITQDHRGLIWIASRTGIAFFNGASWEQAAGDSLAADISQGLLQVDFKGEIWALMSGINSALIRKDLFQWSSVPMPEDLKNFPQSFTQFALARMDTNVVAALVEKSGTMHVMHGNRWQKIPLIDSGISNITSMIVQNNQFCLATPEGVFSVQPETPFSVQPLVNPNQTGQVLCLSVDPIDHSLWLIGEDWIGKLVEGIFDYLLPPQGSLFPCFQESPAPVCAADGFGGVYLSGHYGTQYFHPSSGMEILGPESGLVDNDSRTFFLDRENVMWQGTKRGISKIISRYTTGYSSQQGLLADEVTAILRRRDGTLVLGHNDGLTLWKEGMVTIPFTKSDIHHRVLDLAEDSQGTVLIAGRQRGIGRLTPDGNLTWWTREKSVRGHCVSVVVDAQDRVWAAFGNQLLMGKNGDFSPVPIAGFPLENGYIRRLILGNDGTIYMATGNLGLLAFKEGQIHQWKTGLKDHGNSVFDLLETPQGETLIGTRAGLYKLADRRLVRPSDPWYDIKRPVYFLEMDQQNRLWVGTDNGVIRVDQNRVDHFTVENGLMGRETNRCASLVESDGKIWVGTERGLTVFDAKFENTKSIPPLVFLVQVEAGDQAFSLVDQTEEIILPTPGNTLVFRFSLLTSQATKGIRIQSRLDGLESQWVEQDLTGELALRYTHLDPGTYQFHLKAAGLEQPWSNVISTPEIKLPTPTWRQLWFLALIALALLLALILPVIVFAQRRSTTRLKLEVQEQVAANLAIEAKLEQARDLGFGDSDQRLSP